MYGILLFVVGSVCIGMTASQESCPFNQVYSNRVPCQWICDQEITSCPEVSVPGCTCPNGTMWDWKNYSCVKSADCPVCPENQNFQTCGGCRKLCNETTASTGCCQFDCGCPPTLPYSIGDRCVAKDECPADITTQCADGSSPVLCLTPPCDTAICSQFDEANCTNDYCGGCNAVFDIDGVVLNDNLCNGCVEAFGEQYSTCTVNCDPTCEEPAKPCSLMREKPCQARCACPDGTYKDSIGFCVNKSSCDTPNNACPSNQIYSNNVPCVWQCGEDLASKICINESVSGCHCPNGTLWDGEKCVLQCPTCPGNQEFSTCGSCTVPCDQLDNPPICTLECKIGCSCPFGTYLHGYLCVQRDECPPATTTAPPTKPITTVALTNPPARSRCESNQVLSVCPRPLWQCGQDISSISFASGCTKGCTCQRGTLWNGTSCARKCPTCPGNQRFSTCGSCTVPCKYKDTPPPCTQECRIGCYCPAGTFLNGENCVSADNCPVVTTTAPPTTIAVPECESNQVFSDCPNCIWQCGQDPASTSCLAGCNPGCTCPEGTLWDGKNCVSTCPVCPGNQKYTTCGSCVTTCADKDEILLCTNLCRVGCTCPSGTFLNGDYCVTAAECPAMSTTTPQPSTTTPACRSNQVFSDCPNCIWQCGQDPASTSCLTGCNPGCTCPEGTLWDGDNCVTTCPVCPGNQKFSLCGSCVTPCDKKDDILACAEVCRIGCTCPSGTFLNGNNCVPRDECPVPCPYGETPHQCAVAPCDSARCPRFPSAKCVNNYCGGCTAEFSDGLETLTAEECMGCFEEDGEEWNTCASPCDATCDEPDKPCSTQEVCTRRCACQQGRVRDKDNKCIVRAACPICPSNQLYFNYGKPCVWKCGQQTTFDCLFSRFTDPSGCACTIGTLWNGTSCVGSGLCPNVAATCPNGEHEWKCKTAPCSINNCAAHPEARCDNDYCGGCFAIFSYEGEELTEEDCELPAQSCPIGQSSVRCSFRPCDVEKCPAYPEAECTDNYCGSCNAVFTYNDRELLEDDCRIPTCEKFQNEVWKQCATKCDATCLEPLKPCSLVRSCTRRCACPNGHVRNKLNVCIPRKTCPQERCKLSGQIFHSCKPCNSRCEDVYLPCRRICTPGCSCPIGQFWHLGACVYRRNCPITTTRCPGNQIFSLCPQRRWKCSTPYFPTGLYVCKPRCTCPQFLFWNGEACVSESACSFNSYRW